MRRASQWALARPKAAVIVWLALVAVLALAGRGLDARLQPTDLRVSGSSSAQARALVDTQFGTSATLPVLLDGPSHDVRSQGRALAARLQRTPGMSVVSPWSAGAARDALRPSATQVLMLVSVNAPREQIATQAQRVRDIARAAVSGPVSAHVTGVPLAAHDVARASSRAVRRADLVALPVLLIVLLLVFRTAAAALLPVAFGATTMWAAKGILALLARPLELDAFATGLASMVGLALAVDYSLLMVARVRELRRGGGAHADAVRRAGDRSRHTVLAAGSAIVVAMALTGVMSPTAPMLSAAVGVCTVAVLAMTGATLALPAALLLAGDRLGVATPGAARAAWAPLSAAVTRRPVLTAGVATLALGALALPALHLRTGAPDARELPSSSAARQDFQAIRTASGPGWSAGFEIVSVADRGAMTTPARLSALARLEASLRRDPAVREVFGPGAIARNAAVLRRAGRAMAREQHALQSGAPRQTKDLNRLAGSMSSASSGAGSLTGALDQAASAANRVGAGSNAASAGLQRLQSGVQQASAGARALRTKLASAGSGGQALTRGAGDAGTGAQQIATAIDTVAAGATRLQGELGGLQGRLQSSADDLNGTAAAASSQRADLANQLNAAQAALVSGKQSMQTLAALAAIHKAKASLDATNVASAVQATAGKLTDEAHTVAQLGADLPVAKTAALAREARQLAAGIATLRDRLSRYGQDVSGLVGGSAALTAAISRLDGGSQSLSSGISALQRGVGALESGVAAGRTRSAALASGLAQANGAIAGQRTAPKHGGAPAPQGVSADVVDSGYFVLAALDGRSGATSGLNIAHGGIAARILVIPRADANSAQTRALYSRLRDAAAAFGPKTGTHTVVGGPAAMLIDYRQAMASRLPLVLLVLAAATTLLLVLTLGSVLVPIIGVALNALCSLATLGVVERLFGGDHPLLGGPGHVDATALTAVFAVMFALSIDYQMFIVARVREELLAGAEVVDAIATGMHRVAGVVTGAALSMLVVFGAFATADVASLRVFGVALAVAVVLDATLVRLVLLPALLRLCGRRAWWPLLRPERGGTGAIAAELS